MVTVDGRGVLYPVRLPSFHRESAPEDLHDRIRWFWVPRWDIAPGRTSRQHVLPFPAGNLVVQPAGVTLAGPTTGASHRDLTGSGWAVGALLRPAALAALCTEPGAIRDQEVPVDAPDLHRAVVEAMAHRDRTAGRERAVGIAVGWARENLPVPDGAATAANRMVELIAEDPGMVRVEQVAERLHMSVRGVQRLARRYVGLPPLAVIRRHRLQEAALRLREDPTLRVAQVAADLGYADHAHLSRDFRRVLGLAPSDYRRDPDLGP